MLPKQAIEEFNEIYQKEFGVRLSNEAATQKAVELMNLVKVILRPSIGKEEGVCHHKLKGNAGYSGYTR